MVAGRKRHLDHSKPIIGFRLEFEDNATLADGFGFENGVVLTATLDIGDWVT